MTRDLITHDYRHMTPHELCSECREPATSACPRCAAPTCDRHAPTRRRRCHTCEAEFIATKPDEDRVLNAITIVFLAVVFALVGLGVYHDWMWWAFVACSAPAGWLIARAVRARFLLQKKRPPAELMSHNPPEDDHAPD